MASRSRVKDAGGRLSVELAHYYARIYAAAKAGCLAELRYAGCDEEEAEELFAATLEQIMAKRDPPWAREENRETEQGNRIDVAMLRGFLKRALEDDAVADPVNELLFEYVVVGHLHPSVVAETLPSYINEILGAATREDWQAVTDELIAKAREADGEA